MWCGIEDLSVHHKKLAPSATSPSITPGLASRSALFVEDVEEAVELDEVLDAVGVMMTMLVIVLNAGVPEAVSRPVSVDSDEAAVMVLFEKLTVWLLAELDGEVADAEVPETTEVPFAIGYKPVDEADEAASVNEEEDPLASAGTKKTPRPRKRVEGRIFERVELGGKRTSCVRCG